MEYVFAKWKQSDPSMPTAVYSEIDALRREIRKVEVFGDGHYGFASANASRGQTELGVDPLPPLGEIAADAQFEVRAGTAAEFTELWKKAGGAA